MEDLPDASTSASLVRPSPKANQRHLLSGKKVLTIFQTRFSIIFFTMKKVNKLSNFLSLA